MILKFRTDVDRNGNSKHLIIDTDRKVYFEDGFGGVKISRQDFKELLETVKADGYKSGIKLN